MQDVELFLSLAEIAGIFVGFGALIAIRGGDRGDVYDVTGVGMIVWLAIVVVVLALVPVVVSRFGVGGHELWLACSLCALVLFWVGDEVFIRIFPERRAYMAAQPLRARWRMELAATVFTVPMTIGLVVVVLGLLPEHEAALYLLAVVLMLFMDAWLLLLVVTRAFRPRTAPGASDGPSQPA
jgi:hypothetical protein